jgi:hypothetical protein
VADETTYKDDNITSMWRDYERGKRFLESKGLTTAIPRYVAFYEGDQWAKPTEATKTMPRPVFNFIKMIVDNKVSNIVGSPVKLNFIAENNKVATQKFTRFAHFILKEMGMENIDYEAILTDRKKGTFVKHYYWSEEAHGKKGKFEGGLRCQLIDPLNVYVADPNEKDIQKQKWIMIAVREEVSKVKKMADKKYHDKICSDELESPYGNKRELEDSELVTVLTKYFKKDGEVYYERSTKYTPLKDEATPINPYLVAKKFKIKDVDGKGTSQPDEKLEQDKQENYYMATRYPIEICSLDPSDDCIYGLSEIKNMIVAQKLVNFNLAMGALNLQELGAPKVLVKPNALQGQTLTNQPGQVVVDYTPGNQWGIQNLQATPFTAQALQFAPALIDLIRTVSNATEVITGEMVSKDLSGYAIAQLQAQAQKPIEMQRKRFWQHKEREGKILEMFFKLYYDNKPFTYKNSLEEKIAMRQANPMQNVPETTADIFNGEEFQDINFNIIVEAGAGTQYSEIQAMNLLDKLLEMKLIDLDFYRQEYPPTAMPFKEALGEYIYFKEQKEVEQLRQLVAEQAQMIEQLKATTEQQEADIQNFARELSKSNKINASLQQEYSIKLQQLMGGQAQPQQPK